MHLLHDPACAEYSRLGHPERPARVLETAAHLAGSIPLANWRRPNPAVEQDLLRAHSPEHLARLREPQDFDGDTPYHEGIADHAALAAGAAVEAAHAALRGERPFCLMRPPGHHATRNQAMGFCYLNSIAIAALAARAAGVSRVAVWDFDAHHGNGTEAILKGVPGVLFASVHQVPGYPGTGLASSEGILNYPVPPGSDPESHLEILESSWEAVLRFRPELVLVSAGFDAYRGDPLTELSLAEDDFRTLGTWCSEGPPCACVLEGGYSEQLPLLVETFLRGWWRAG